MPEILSQLPHPAFACISTIITEVIFLNSDGVNQQAIQCKAGFVQSLERTQLYLNWVCTEKEELKYVQ